MKDILKMTRKQRIEYLSFVDLNECNKQLIDFAYDVLDLSERYEFSNLWNKSQKLLLGNNQSWENKKHSQLNYGIILIKLNVLIYMGYYEKFINWSDNQWKTN